MPRLGRLLAMAARRIAADPRLRAKVSEVVENDIKPKAKQAWERNKPRLEAKASEWNEKVREKATRENLGKFAGKVRDRLRERPKK